MCGEELAGQGEGDRRALAQFPCRTHLDTPMDIPNDEVGRPRAAGRQRRRGERAWRRGRPSPIPGGDPQSDFNCALDAPDRRPLSRQQASREDARPCFRRNPTLAPVFPPTLPCPVDSKGESSELSTPFPLSCAATTALIDRRLSSKGGAPSRHFHRVTLPDMSLSYMARYRGRRRTA